VTPHLQRPRLSAAASNKAGGAKQQSPAIEMSTKAGGAEEHSLAVEMPNKAGGGKEQSPAIILRR
jgi:hypothetical protein